MNVHMCIRAMDVEPKRCEPFLELSEEVVTRTEPSNKEYRLKQHQNPTSRHTRSPPRTLIDFCEESTIPLTDAMIQFTDGSKNEATVSLRSTRSVYFGHRVGARLHTPQASTAPTESQTPSPCPSRLQT
jgi:hypothetical protein